MTRRVSPGCPNAKLHAAKHPLIMTDLALAPLHAGAEAVVAVRYLIHPWMIPTGQPFLESPGLLSSRDLGDLPLTDLQCNRLSKNPDLGRWPYSSVEDQCALHAISHMS